MLEGGRDLTLDTLVLQMKHFERVYQPYLIWHDTWRIHDNKLCIVMRHNVLFDKWRVNMAWNRCIIGNPS